MSFKSSNNIIGNRTRDLPTCSAVPQPNCVQVSVSGRGPEFLFRTGFLGREYELECLAMKPVCENKKGGVIMTLIECVTPSLSEVRIYEIISYSALYSTY